MTDAPTESGGESAWAKLRRRKVVQWGLVYVAGAWGFLEGLQYVSDAFQWPPQFRQIALLALLIGLPIVLVLAWYHGDRGEQRLGGAELTIITLLFLLGGGIFWQYERTYETPTVADRVGVAPAPAVAPAKSIAVLPFVNMSEDAGNEYFADGLAEELLNLLAKIPELRVAARTSAFKFKGEKIDVQEVAQKLNVAHVLEGSVRKSGNKVRITAQLIKAADGYHVWSETYDRTLNDIFVVQDDIAAEVVKALKVTLKVTLLGKALATHSKPQDPQAYNLLLQGRYFLIRGGQQADLERSIHYFRQALARDRAYAPAWAGLSRAYARQADSGFVPVADGYPRAREAAEKALALDPQLVDAHLAMGWIQNGYDWDWAAADASFRRALELEPGNAWALRAFGIQAAVFGRWDEALDATDKAIERDPLGPNGYQNLGVLLMAVNRDTKAESAYRKALELDPGGASRHLAIGRNLLLQGKAEAALREMQQEPEEIWRLSGLPLVYHALGRHSESDATLAGFKSKYAGEMAYQIAEVHAFRGEADLAFEWLERAYDQRDAGVTEIKYDPLFRPLIDDPRYKAFLKKMKLPE